ncbi:hypothetical protein IGB42_01765 [Andreprevotia sp. IGB-42]|uniref:hypothetical protein n=1 Tax=Andreprevotia sp. IGB-42 TaxID=2497473 RepID=UPI00135A875C|nr:hypothetical protein [Andreprevotia sp. IGB-42]KAF0813414.1 hypothetical protein IGB42_01765 [Andreprevotia sp. IGB-42]
MTKLPPILGEYQANGTSSQETVWLGDTPIAVLNPTADPADPRAHVLADQLGTPRQITDLANNAVVWRWGNEA